MRMRYRVHPPKCHSIASISPPIRDLSKSSPFKSGLSENSLSLDEANIIELVRQKDGIIFNLAFIRSPSYLVDSRPRRIKVAIAPMPANAKCKNIVTVCATFSFVKRKLVTYVKGTIARGYSKNRRHTLSY